MKYDIEFVSVGNIVQTWFISDLTLGHVNVAILVAHASQVHASIGLSGGPVAFSQRLLNISEALGYLSELGIDVVVVGFSLVSVLVELSPQVELQVHLQGLGQSTPGLLVESLCNVVSKFLFPDENGRLDFVSADVAQPKKNLLALNNHLGFLVTQERLSIG